MNKHRASLLLAGVAGMLAANPRLSGMLATAPAGNEGMVPDVLTRHSTVAEYHSGLPWRGNHHGERLARQMAKGMLDYSASEKCIERINERRDAQVRALLDAKVEA